ncbi:cytochrome P450 3A4-like [Procambarus clarkii]|uniref:cytochrome P450 3A4-like n=1 Tax=Procambarus clarkii TaxID=6728 RepID=UPI0037424DFA
MANIVGMLRWVVSGVASHTWTLLVASLLLYVVWWVQHRRRQHSVFSKLGIPYITPHLIYGSNHVMRKPGALATDIIGQWIQEYGKVFGFYVGWKPTLVVADLDLIKQVLIKDFHNFSNRPALVVRAHPVVDTVVGLRDQRWKDVRAILAPTFSMVKMKHMAGIMNEKIDELNAIIGKKSATGKPVELYSTFQGLTLDVISECALAMKTNIQRDQDKDEFFVGVKGFLKNAINPAILLALYFPVFASVMSYVSNKLALSGRMTNMVVNHLKSVIEVRRKDLDTKYVDVLQLMLEAAESRQDTSAEGAATNGASTPLPGKERSQHKLLTDDEIIANAWVFLLGGFETTANTLTYTTYLIATHPEVQERLYEELCDVIKGDPDHLTYEQVKELKYLDQVLSESLRLYPPVVTFISRESAQDFKLGDMVIPKDMSIMVPIWQLHRDPEQWTDPETFDPHRFSSDTKAAEARHPMAYIPFGAGPRNCPGMRFAQLEAKLTLARILKSYRLETCESTPKQLTFIIPTVAINPKEGVYVKAVPRELTPKLS